MRPVARTAKGLTRHGRTAPRCSIVIPAHDEEAVIGACLAPLAPLAARGEFEIVVVPNGCSDRTRQVAAAVPGVEVIEVAEASKVAALNAGDLAATAWPRLYLDADVVLPASAALALADVLTTPDPVVGSVGVRFVLDDRPWPVRAFYRIYQRLPYITDGLVGLGLYGLSAAGRERFGAFPDLVADDLFVQRLFAVDERRVLAEHHFDVRVPLTVAALTAVRTRTAAGNAELAAAVQDPRSGVARDRSTSSTLHALSRLVKDDPRRSVDIAAYCAITGFSRWKAREAGVRSWQRDATTR